MKKDYTLVFNAHLVDAELDVPNGAVLICDGKIAGFPSKEAVKEMLSDDNIDSFDAKGLMVMPAFIDMHAHFRDPGLTQKEDIVSGSKAAAAGGYGTVVLMPNTKPVISSQKAALENNKKASEAGFADVIQSVSITKDFDGKTVSHLDSLDSKKVPLITEDGKEVCDSSVMLKAMQKAAQKNLIVSCHCEDPFLAGEAKIWRKKALDILNKNKTLSAAQKKEAAGYLKKANELLRTAENSMTVRNLELAEIAKCRIHLCHVSTQEACFALWLAKKSGAKVTAEVTPHHLALTGEKAPSIFNIVNPPLREEIDRTFCIDALKNGLIDVISTDHAPHTEADKKSGAPGFSGLETAFAVCNTILVKENHFTLQKLSALMSANAARILGLKDRGFLQEGMRADLVLVDPDKQWTVRGKDFVSKGKFTPFEGKKLSGKVIGMFLGK